MGWSIESFFSSNRAANAALIQLFQYNPDLQCLYTALSNLTWRGQIFNSIDGIGESKL